MTLYFSNSFEHTIFYIIWRFLMNTFKKIYCRIFQTCFRIALPFLPYREPELIDGFKNVPAVLKKHHISHILLVTDPGVYKLGLTKPLEKQLSKSQISCTIYKDTVANPTSANVEDAKDLYLDHECQALLAFGGGSSMDCAKAVGARLARPHKSLSKMEGILKIWHRLPLLIAVPTTAGTGSETTLAAVITDADTHHKYAINDFNLIPDYAVLEPSVTYGLPPQLTATTGMDALTHAIEGYITKGHCTISDMFHLEAIKLISENLRGAVQNTPEGREGMALGQYIAGMGFSNVGLGIVHSMAHGLSALYDTPHGVACAIILPTGLEYNKSVAGERYRAVGKAMGVTGIDEMNDAEAADATIAAVKQLSADVGIPANLHGILKEEDIQFLAESAFADACCPGNPRDTSVEEIKELYKGLL